jgi:4-hydroxy-3-polyprenylbenzoate decarboxylase
MELRRQVKALAAADDLAVVDEQVAPGNVLLAAAAEAARTNGPAVLFENPDGRGRLVAGARGGPDKTRRRSRFPRSRIAEALGLERDVAYVAFLDRLVDSWRDSRPPDSQKLAAEVSGFDLGGVCLPRVPATSEPVLTSGIVAGATDEGPRWAPVRATVQGSKTLRASVPSAFASATGESVSVATGAPTAAVLAAQITAGRSRLGTGETASAVAASLDDVAVTDDEWPTVPADSEVVVRASSQPADSPPPGPHARWEATVPTTPLSLSVERIATRPDPMVPVVPLGEPLADDVHVTGLVESARLYARVDGYWGVSPVEWVSLPVEAGLGVCLVASELLYAGFEWQLANTLFSYGSLFDKVVILDAGVSPDDLGRALDDIWVKAHPSRDWTFGEPHAPAPAAPRYREDGATGARLYVNAAWDPQWDEEFIAPEVGFEATYSEELQAAVRDRWGAFGFETGNATGDNSDSPAGDDR